MSNNKNYILKSSDKNVGTKVVTHEWYISSMKKHLYDENNFTKIILTPFHKMKIVQYLYDVLNSKLFPNDKIKDFILHNINNNNNTNDKNNEKGKKKNNSETFKACVPHLLGKIHKLKTWSLNELQSRLIISCVTYYTTPLSQWLDTLLQPLVQQLSTITKDSKTFVSSIEKLIIPEYQRSNCILFTSDITSLYSNIPTMVGLEMIKRFLYRDKSQLYLKYIFSNLDIHYIISIILKCFSLILKNNIVQFLDEYFIQINGTAMGQSCAVVYANIFVFEIEYEPISLSLSNGIILYYTRFIDDLFGVLTHVSHTSSFNELLNNLHPSMKFTTNFSLNEVEFLDTVIYKGSRFNETGIFDLRIHQKIINRYLYIPAHSSHTYYNKVGWIKAELIRYIRNTSSFEEYCEIKWKFYQRLQDRGYRPSFLCNIMDSISFTNRQKYLKNNDSINNDNNNDNNNNYDNNKDFPNVFVTHFHPSIHHNDIKHALCENWDEKMIEIYGEKPFIGYKRTKNLKEMLIKSKYSLPPS